MNFDFIDDFLRYAEISPADAQGARVLELGPGDNFGIPLAFLGDGADQVKTIDRFFATHVVGQENELIPHPAVLSEQQVEAAEPLIDEIRPRLRPRFRDLSDRDLATAGVFLVARKSK